MDTLLKARSPSPVFALPTTDHRLTFPFATAPSPPNHPRPANLRSPTQRRSTPSTPSSSCPSSPRTLRAYTSASTVMSSTTSHTTTTSSTTSSTASSTASSTITSIAFNSAMTSTVALQAQAATKSNAKPLTRRPRAATTSPRLTISTAQNQSEGGSSNSTSNNNSNSNSNSKNSPALAPPKSPPPRSPRLLRFAQSLRYNRPRSENGGDATAEKTPPSSSTPGSPTKGSPKLTRSRGWTISSASDHQENARKARSRTLSFRRRPQTESQEGQHQQQPTSLKDMLLNAPPQEPHLPLTPEAPPVSTTAKYISYVDLPWGDCTNIDHLGALTAGTVTSKLSKQDLAAAEKRALVLNDRGLLLTDPHGSEPLLYLPMRHLRHASLNVGPTGKLDIIVVQEYKPQQFQQPIYRCHTLAFKGSTQAREFHSELKTRIDVARQEELKRYEVDEDQPEPENLSSDASSSFSWATSSTKSNPPSSVASTSASQAKIQPGSFRSTSIYLPNHHQSKAAWVTRF
eukprot:m.124130 g.124130  ORF g.124130 m.124130 type:complete len:515 (+) comp15586_c2_seq4:176-1720(+)